MDQGFGDSLLPQWLYDGEVQAVLIVGLMCVGAWVLFTWIIQIIFSVLWPFVLVCLVLIFMPQWRKALAKDFVPKQLEVIKAIGMKVWNSNNNTTTPNC